MKKKYRIQELRFYGLTQLNLRTIYIAQYKIMGIWMNMDIDGHRGYFMKNSRTWCFSKEEAENRIKIFQEGLKLASHWTQKSVTNIDYPNL